MSKNEFEETKQYLHLADNSTLDKTDKFTKVQSLFDVINKQSQQNYKPNQHVSVDKSIVPCFGKHGPNNTSIENPLDLVINFGLW